MYSNGLFALAGTLLLLSPVCFAGEIQVHKAKEIQVHRGNTIETHQANVIAPHAAKDVKPQPAKEIRSHQAQQVERPKSAEQARLFTKADYDKMHRNDVKAGRTKESMGKGDGLKSGTGANPYNDPYNTGGWNYNTNQSASPIWNPNRQ